ncbi:MAG: CD3324 family protein [Lutispora sp.]|nr:CD3324 family protein [Lutispora sp.]
MAYKNGKNILPIELLEELQQYIQGEIIYIPKKKNERARWGEVNGTRELMKDRNSEIYNLYKKGFKIEDLIKLYHLSEDSIRRIVYNGNTKVRRVGK